MPGGNITYVYLFSALAVFILVIACVNFMNLATARSQQRGREVGMRKVLGAHRMQLARQFLGESVLQSLLALAMALLLLVGLHPAFETLTGKPLPFDPGTGAPVLLGFQDEQVVVLPIGHSEQLRERAEVVKQAMLQHPTIVGASASHSIPSYFLNNFSYRREDDPCSDRVSLRDVSIDHDFIDTYGMEVLAGRTFSRDLVGDSTAFVLRVCPESRFEARERARTSCARRAKQP